MDARARDADAADDDDDDDARHAREPRERVMPASTSARDPRDVPAYGAYVRALRGDVAGGRTNVERAFMHVFRVERPDSGAVEAHARSRFVDFETYDERCRQMTSVGEDVCRRALCALPRSAVRTMDSARYACHGQVPSPVRIDRDALRAKIVAAERLRTAWLRDATTMAMTTTTTKQQHEGVKGNTTKTTATTARTTTRKRTTTKTTTHGTVARAKAHANGPYYHSRTFVAMDAPPREDSDDEDPVPQEIAEDEALLNEFIDFSREEIDFMLAWNVVSRRYRAMCDEDVPGLLKAFVRANFASLRKNVRFYNMFVAAATGMFEHGVVHRQGLVDALKFARDSRNLKMFEPPPATFATSSTRRDEDGRAPMHAKPKAVRQNHMSIVDKHERALADERSTPIRPKILRDDGDDDDIRKAKKPKPSTYTRAKRKGPCTLCHATQSPSWRPGPHHAPVLCNKCGMRWVRRGVAAPLRAETHPEVAPSMSSPTTPPGEDDRGAFAHPWGPFMHVLIQE